MNQEQADFFESFGYVVIRQLFDTNDLAVLAREFHAGLDAQYPADRNDGAERLWTRLTDEDTPFAASLMEDRRFLGPAQRLCGPDVLGIGIDVNRYIGNTGWHPDTADENQVAVKFIFYLDAVDADTGALRVIPASHLLRGAERRDFAQAVSARALTDVPCQAVATKPGDVIAFDIRTWHASYGGTDNRRAWNLDYFANPKSAEQIQQILALGSGHAGSIRTFKPRRQYNYSRSWLDNPRNSSVRQRWIDRFEEIGYLDQPGVGEPRRGHAIEEPDLSSSEPV